MQQPAKKTWFITGSSRGLGRALTEAVLAAGHNVFATARTPAQLDDLAKRYPDSMQPSALDVTDANAASGAIQAAIDRFGRIDVLVNNAGYGDAGSIEDTPLSAFRDQIETNLFGVINVTKAALPFLREQRAGHILQISSVGGRIGPPSRGAYSAAKWGVEGFSEVLAKEVGPLGIHVTIIEPGAFRTDFAGTSTTLREGRPEYDSTVGAMIRFQRTLNGTQAGDPAKAAAAILQIADLSDPPLRLLLGSDAVRAVENNDRAKMDADEKWRSLSVSTDFASSEPVKLPWERESL